MIKLDLDAVATKADIMADWTEFRFDPLDWQDQRGMSYDESNAAAKAARDKNLAAIRKMGLQGFTVRGWCLRGQLRQYASYGNPDGRMRTVFYITVRAE